MEDFLQKAIYLAKSVHKNQENGLYFENHIQKCLDIATNEFFHHFIIEEEILLPSIVLHDVIEDSNGLITHGFLCGAFNSYVANIVYGVTDGPGKNRKERKQYVYDVIQKNDYYRDWRTLVKLVDRLANIRRGGKILMYIEEHPEFRKALYREGVYEDIWEEIERVLSPITL